MTDAAPGSPATTPITKTIRQAFRAEIKRTGITALMLLKNAADLPDGLNAAHVNRWIGGIVTSASMRHVAYVTRRWAALPDDAGRTTTGGKPLPRRGRRVADGNDRIPVTEAMASELRAELARTGIAHATMLDGIDDLPPGLTPRIVKGWLYRDAATTDARYWEFVMTRLNTAPDLATPLPVPIKKPRKDFRTPKS